jgi:hypothetical protein
VINTSIPSSVTSTNRGWLVGGNNFGTVGTGYQFGTLSNDHVDLISNGVVRGRLSNLGEFFIGATNTALSGDLMNGVGNATFPWAVNGYTNFNGGAVYGAIQGANTTQFAAIQGENNSTTGTFNSSAVRGINASTTAGTGFRMLAGSGPRMGVTGMFTSTTGSYTFGVYGSTPASAIRTGAVFGDDTGIAMGALGYYAANSVDYAVYGFGQAYQAGTATGDAAQDESLREPNTMVGLGIYGGVMGGWIRGMVYGAALRGERYSLYVDGKSFANQPMINLIDTGGDKRTVTYSISSPTPDVYARGRGKVVAGRAMVKVPGTFRAAVSKRGDLSDGASDVVITVTALGESKGLYLADITSEGFVVKENGGGTSTVDFTWIAMATRADVPVGDLPEEVVASDFDAKMDGVMSNENSPAQGTPLWWDGAKVRFDAPPPRVRKVKPLDLRRDRRTPVE